MDNLTKQLADYAHRLSFDDLPAEIVTAAKQRALDAMGCALGGRDCEAARIARRLTAGGAPASYPGRVLGTKQRTTAEAAAFANTVMIRYLDFNDSHHASHPSDMLGAILGLAEAAGVDGKQLIAAIVVAYETTLRIVQATELREKGWDQGYAMGIGTAAGIGNLLGLPMEKITHAIAITAVANVPLRATRAGLLSHWKGAATAYAGRNATFATLLAAEGMTSPDKPFEGRHGLWEKITGPFQIKPYADRGGDFLLPHSFLKYWPVEANTQAAVWAALELRPEVKADDIESIDISTYWSAWHETASEPEKWDPKTRETADHSLPYIFTRAFLDGTITVRSFDDDAIADPRNKPLLKKIAVRMDDDIEAIYRAAHPNTYLLRMQVRLQGGSRKDIEIIHPRGMCQNPMTDEQIGCKFSGLAEPVLGTKKAAEAAEAWLTIDKAPSVGKAMQLLEAEG